MLVQFNETPLVVRYLAITSCKCCMNFMYTAFRSVHDGRGRLLWGILTSTHQGSRTVTIDSAW